MANKWIKAISLAFMSSTLLSACVSTETVEPQNFVEKDEIVLTLTAPEGVSTRADNGYKLRYVAKIYQGSSSASWDFPLDRQEIIDGESNNRIVFKVNPHQNYGILVFADYIPSEYQADSKGLYKDYFYNTTSNSKTVYIRTNPGDDSSTLSPSFFNNHNYDAFFGIHSLRKEEAEVTVNMTLTRITAQVIFRDNSDISGEYSLDVSNLGIRQNFSLNIEQSSAPSKINGNAHLVQTATIDDSNRDLFFFYTLADLKNSPQNVFTDFTVTKDNNQPDFFSVTEIPVKSNFKTIVTGKFLPEESSDDQSGKDDEPTKAGDIILNLTTNYTWEQETLSK